MIKEQYVSFEVAKLLEEKGFDNECSGYYNQERVLQRLSACSIKDTLMSPFYFDCIPAPTHQMAMKWLREMRNLFIEIQCYGCEADKKAHFEYSYVINEYVKINNGICTIFGLEKRNAKSRFSSYEDAAEAAIKYCLEEIIK